MWFMVQLVLLTQRACAFRLGNAENLRIEMIKVATRNLVKCQTTSKSPWITPELRNGEEAYILTRQISIRSLSLHNTTMLQYGLSRIFHYPTTHHGPTHEPTTFFSFPIICPNRADCPGYRLCWC